MEKFEHKLNEYAKLTIEVGINLQKDQPLVISAPVEGVEFVRLLAKYAYEAGANDVFINWSDDTLTKLKYENAPFEVFEDFPKWKQDTMIYYAEKGAGFISIHSDDPELLKDIDPKKIAVANKASGIGMKEFRKYTMNDINSWCVISIPTKKWASRVFKDVDEETAVEMLWDAIFKATRMDLDNPVEAWKEHVKSLEDRSTFLNEKEFKTLHFTSSNGTDLVIDLPEGHIWQGGASKNIKGIQFVANMPTEEVFTLPHKNGVNGVVYSTKPLNYGGNLIDDFKVEFKEGKVVNFEAKVGHEILKDLLDIDDGAKYLGEVALVPYSSPISQANIVFLNTLFDENASCHLAFGRAYPTSIKNGEKMSDDELSKLGVNNSLTHEDFMIGSEDLSIIGETKDGEKIQIFKDGEWAI
ncbi:aminopeptidase [Tissierella sp. Yu-01]|uniref:aminopeptidase n=1 Tax=Tissierella sp. Yu-01 TaxID=3035694 RepID=UPI00240E36A1|nr:aminopeptidase [Tissierella sp. Yu-01]WFA08098.1 aminopeptidase [Tissierella sp. Yu-01]